MTRAPFRVLRGRVSTDNLRQWTSFRRGSGSVTSAGLARRHKRDAPSDTPSRSNGHRPPFLVPAALPPDRTRPDAFDPRPGRRRTDAADRAGFHLRAPVPELPKPQHGDPAVCLTLANAAFVLDHVNSVRPARSFTRGMRHNHFPSMTWIIDGSWEASPAAAG